MSECTLQPFMFATCSKAWVLTALTLGLVQITLKAWMFVHLFLCQALPYGQRPCIEPIIYPRSCIKHLNYFIISEVF